MIRAASTMLADPPERLDSIAVPMDADQGAVLAELKQKIAELDDGTGVLVLADIYGATHSRTARKATAAGRVALVAGANLPMLVRALNYRHLSLEKLVDKAVVGGHNGIIVVDARSETRGMHK